ncbi:pyrimidine-nucleoside phosphorylase [Bacilli bacterium PM5-9]|nr:pyrimidine-nucleoside phosphorylase [Bacilli bacterium PM5-9]
MNIVDIIEKKRDKKELSSEEIDFFINGYVNDTIKDYQISALLMAIVLNGMNVKETSNLTNSMMNSGDIYDLSMIEGIKCDKHSTGGVGDKTTLILAPLLASAGIKISKMSGRGLGHTGGTLDKLESIPNFNINLEIDDFIKQVNEIGIAIIGQSANLVPADKKLYALRDVSGTVQSIPLIASSIMSKKLASGSDAIILDVKVGKGAFMKTIDEAKELAKLMVMIGKDLNKDIKAVITDMNRPLGFAIGNNLEVIEAINTLQGNGPKDLEELCLRLGSIMLTQAKKADDVKQAYDILKEKINNNEAFNKFRDLVIAQGGDVSYVDDPSLFDKAKYEINIYANEEGFLNDIDALSIGKLALELGAGRHTKEEAIDYSAGVYLHKQLGEKIKTNDFLATLYTNKDNENVFIKLFKDAIKISSNKIEKEDLIKTIIQ